MRNDLTVKDVMSHTYLGVSESDSVREVAALLLEEEAPVVGVVRGGSLKGMVTDRLLLAAVLDNASLDDVSIADRMRIDVPTVTTGTDLSEAASILSDMELAYLFVLDETGEPVGVLSENDIITAVTSVLATNPVDRESSEVLSQEEDDRSENDTASDELTTQSVCELCGTLKTDLTNFNGQLVCSDCRSV